MNLKVIIAALSLVLLATNSQAKDDPKVIRDKLFKFNLLNESHSAIHNHILKDIDIRSINYAKLPALALCSIKRTNASSKSDREYFIKSIASTVKYVNTIILEHRKTILFVRDKRKSNSPLSEDEKKKFSMICSFYQSNNIDELLRRVAPVPNSLAIAQAILESGFGSHDFMRSRNAFFGMMKNSKQLYSFDTLLESVVAYTKTLNVNASYRQFRAERSNFIRKSQTIDGVKLSKFLGKYYVSKIYDKQVISLIKEHKLTEFDHSYRSC